MRQRGISFKRALNEAIRTGLVRRNEGRRRRFVQQSFRLGAEQNFRWDKALVAAQAMEDEEIGRTGACLRKLLEKIGFEMGRAGPAEQLTRFDEGHLKVNLVAEQKLLLHLISDGAIGGFQAGIVRKSRQVFGHPLPNLADQRELRVRLWLLPCPSGNGENQEEKRRPQPPSYFDPEPGYQPEQEALGIPNKVPVRDPVYRTRSSTSVNHSGRFKTSRGFEPSGGPMMPSRCIVSRMRAARP